MGDGKVRLNASVPILKDGIDNRICKIIDILLTNSKSSCSASVQIICANSFHDSVNNVNSLMMIRFAAVALVLRAFIGSLRRNFITLVHLMAVVIAGRVSILSG